MNGYRLRKNPDFHLLPLSDEQFNAGLHLFAKRFDKEWSLIDCISFETMARLGISAALTADHHFIQAGYRALLLED